MTDSPTTTAALYELLSLPRGRQLAGLDDLRASIDRTGTEAWNTAFGPDSLYDAWSRLPFVAGIYQHNRTRIIDTLSGRADWHVVEIGAGSGMLWDGVLHDLGPGTLTVVDPHAEAHEAVRRRLPAHVAMRSVVAEVGEVDIPDADVAVCSLTLHHHPGRDRIQREQHGLAGDGKLEVLRRIITAVQARSGIGLLNEADCYNEIDLAPGDPVLVDHFLDVYVRRAARAVAHAVETDPGSPYVPAWNVILQQWCLDQVSYAFAPLARRDVYELDIVSWLSVLAAAGADHVQHRFTDEWNLFVQYVFA